MRHAEAVALIRGKRNAVRRRLGCKTWGVIHADGSVGIIYHWTEVVRICDDGNYVLRSGGYQTVTTKRRINQWVPWEVARVWQRNFVWYVSRGETTEEFSEGMIVGASPNARWEG